MIEIGQSESLFHVGQAGRLFLLGFLKILALLLAFFFLDRERREPRHRPAGRRGFSRWLQWPIVLSLAVACGSEGYDAYLKYQDDKEYAAKTARLLESIERRSRPLFPMQIHGMYTLDLSGPAFNSVRAMLPKFVEGDAVSPEALAGARRSALDSPIREVFHTSIDSTLFFLKGSDSPGISKFVAHRSEKAIELSVGFETQTSCGADDRSAIRMLCSWSTDVLEIPVNTPLMDRFGKGTYVHGGIQFYPDLAGSAVIVRSCLELRDNSPQPELVRELKRALGLRYLGITIAGGDSFTLKEPVEHQHVGNCDYVMYRFGQTVSMLDSQLDEY